MNELIKPDSFLKAAIEKHQRETMPAGTAGDLLLFKKGEYERGSDKTLVPDGTIFKPNMYEFWHGWQRFHDGHVTRLDICRFFEGCPCQREELGDNDQELWETGEDGKPRDPWSHNWRIVMRDEAGELVTFSTNSFGGKKAWNELLDAYKDNVGEHPNMWPVVAIKTGYYDTKRYKHVPKPLFKIVYWDEAWGSPPNGAVPAPVEIEAPKAENAFEAPDHDTELNDEIPY